MSEIERYTSEYGSGYDGEGGYGFMQEDAEGAWVSFEDHQRIVAELEQKLAEAEKEISESECPRPINGASNTSTNWCVLSNHCGCGRNELLQRLTDANIASERTELEQKLAERDAYVSRYQDAIEVLAYMGVFKNAENLKADIESGAFSDEYEIIKSSAVGYEITKSDAIDAALNSAQGKSDEQ